MLGSFRTHLFLNATHPYAHLCCHTASINVATRVLSKCFSVMPKFWLSIFISCTAFLFLDKPSLALPFSPDPVSFAGWLNQQKWKDRSLSAKFEYLGDCEYANEYGEAYSCSVGYVTINDNLKPRKCRVQVGFAYDRIARFRDYDCQSIPVKDYAKSWINKFNSFIK